MSPEERERLVHHEASHAVLDVGDDEAGEMKPRAGIKGHDMEEMLATVARYGAADPEQAKLIAHAAAHPETQRMIEAAGWHKAQALLFAPIERTVAERWTTQSVPPIAPAKALNGERHL